MSPRALIPGLFALLFTTVASVASAAPPTPPPPARAPRAPPPAGITVPITHLRNLGKGTLYVRLLGRTDRVSGDEKPLRELRMAASKANLKVVIPAVPPGEYAVFVLHDMDGDKKVTTNFIGIPDEDIAVSRNGKGGPLGGPRWKDVKFKHGPRATTLDALKMAHLYD